MVGRLLTIAGLLAVNVCAANTPSAALHYRLKVSIDPSMHRLEAEAWIQHPPSSRFYLNKALPVREVIADGKAARFHLDSSAPALPYSPASVAMIVEAEHISELRLKYRGALTDIIARINLISPDLVELAGYSGWYPQFEGTNVYTFALETSLPANLVVTTNGRLRSERNEKGQKICSWSSYGPVLDSVILASPKLHELRGGDGSTQIDVLSTSLPAPVLQSKIAGLAAGITRLTGLYGPPQAQGELQLAFSPRGGWGYSRVPLIVVSEERALEVLKQEQGEARDFRGNAHELAHFWWMIADTATPDDWINEGLAEFTAFRLTVERYGKSFAEMRTAEYRSNAGRNQTSAAIAETEGSSPDREINRYDKAALMFLEAQHRFGEKPLDQVLRRLYSRFAAAHNATTADFLKEVQDGIGTDAASYFREELYRKPAVMAPPQ